MPRKNKKLKLALIITAYNEEQFIGRCLDSLLHQSLLPSRIIVVDDGSTDKTLQVIQEFSKNTDLIQIVRSTTKTTHQPGAKVIKAFKRGLSQLAIDDYDVICKFDADLEFPKNYLEALNEAFIKNKNLGLWGGVCSIEKNGIWKTENLTNEDHVRGALKAYRVKAFKSISRLKTQMGWDTADEFKLRYRNWQIYVEKSLKVKHLKPTATAYQDSYFKKQGEVFYALRYGFLLSFLAGLKIAFKRNKISKVNLVLTSYKNSKTKQIRFLLNEKEGGFLRQYRWKQIWRKYIP